MTSSHRGGLGMGIRGPDRRLSVSGPQTITMTITSSTIQIERYRTISPLTASTSPQKFVLKWNSMAERMLRPRVVVDPRVQHGIGDRRQNPPGPEDGTSYREGTCYVAVLHKVLRPVPQGPDDPEYKARD